MVTKSLGIVFPGQGSQAVGMLQDIATEYPEVKKTFALASSVLDYDLWQLVHEGPSLELDKTIHTQPALLTASYAIWQILQTKKNLEPTLLAGHSLGEYTALVCAEALTFTDAIRLVAARGQFMQEAVPIGQGALAAILGLNEEQVIAICDQAAIEGEILSAANFNSIGQVVIAGHTEAVERALILAQEAGAKLTKLLPVSVPSHCVLMKPAADRLSSLLEKTEIKTPQISIINNVDVKKYESPAEIRDGLKRQLYLPVRWVETIQYFSTFEINHIIECGPGKVLSGLNKRINGHLKLSHTADLNNLALLLKIEENHDVTNP